MADKNQIDLSAYDGRLVNVDEFLNERRNAALTKSRTRQKGYSKPQNWDQDYPGKTWLNCIATATDNYGGDSYEKYNPAFHANPQKYGFRLLGDNEASIPGDIVQHYRIDNKGKALDPHHAVTVNEVDDKGLIKSINYSNGDDGEVNYRVAAKNYWRPGEAEVYGSEYDGATDTTKDLVGTKGAYRYRYVGTPAELQAINEHNAAVKAKNLEVYGNENGPKPQSRVSPLKTKPLYSEHPADLRKLNIFQLAEFAK